MLMCAYAFDSVSVMLSLFEFIDIHVFTGFSGFVPTSDFSFKLTDQCIYPNA